MDNPNLNQAKEIEKKLENYASPEGIITKELERGLWYVEHRRQFRLVIIGFLILVAAVSWVYAIYGFAYYLARGMKEDEILTKQLVQASSVGHEYVAQIGARQLSLGPVGILKSSGQRYDLYVQLKNDNQRWWAEFDYYFLAAGKPTEKVRGYILPLADKYLLALAQEFAAPPADARLIIENIGWHRLDAHKIPDWQAYYESRLAIASRDVKFTPAGGSQKLNQLSFNLVNQTAYNYWEVGLTILLMNGGGLANVNHYGLSDFMSGQTKPVAINWAGSVGPVSEVKIIPEINIMKDDIYIPYEGGVGQEK